MHLEFLVEDLSGKRLLETVVPHMISNHHTFSVHSYKGVGRIPKNLSAHSDPAKRILLEQLPKLLSGYGRTFAGYPSDYRAAVIVICDLDDRCLKTFRQELLKVERSCHPSPTTRFCIAVEEGEAWMLGDRQALREAFPSLKEAVLESYTQDSICGTWERLADAVYKGGSQALARLNWHDRGREKCIWAEKIGPHMDIKSNLSPSFNYFVRKVKELTM